MIEDSAHREQWNIAIGGDAAETGAGPGSYDIRQSVWHVNVSCALAHLTRYFADEKCDYSAAVLRLMEAVGGASSTRSSVGKTLPPTAASSHTTCTALQSLQRFWSCNSARSTEVGLSTENKRAHV